MGEWCGVVRLKYGSFFSSCGEIGRNGFKERDVEL